MSQALVPMGDTQIEVRGFSSEQQNMLQEALPTSLIKERKGPGGRMLKYITGKTAIDNANRIFGFGRWGYRVLSKSHEKCGDSEYYTADIELYVIGCPFPFPGEGVGVVTSNNVEGHEKARKESVTDAMKRSLRHFGDQFGLCLYSEDSLVEDAQGNLVPVKNVHSQNGNQQPVRKVVDASQSHHNGQQTPVPAQQSLPSTNGNGTVKSPLQRALGAAKQRALSTGVIASEVEFSGILDQLGIVEVANGEHIKQVNLKISEMITAKNGVK